MSDTRHCPGPSHGPLGLAASSLQLHRDILAETQAGLQVAPSCCGIPTAGEVRLDQAAGVGAGEPKLSLIHI